MRRALGLGVLVALAVVLLGAGSTPASTTDEARSLSLIQRARSDAGRPPLRPVAELQAVAHQHAAEMAAANRLYHNGDLQQEVHGWEALGENVGRGSSADDVHRLLMASAAHRANILSTTFTEIGVGVAWRGTVVYIAQVFRRPARRAAAPAPSPTTTAPPAPSPRPVAPPPPPPPTTTLAPPMTTTTTTTSVSELEPPAETVGLAVWGSTPVAVDGPVGPARPSGPAALATSLVAAVLAGHVAHARRWGSALAKGRRRTGVR